MQGFVFVSKIKAFILQVARLHPKTMPGRFKPQHYMTKKKNLHQLAVQKKVF